MSFVDGAKTYQSLSMQEQMLKERYKPALITPDMPFFKDTMPLKKDLSAHCNLDDEDKKIMIVGIATDFCFLSDVW